MTGQAEVYYTHLGYVVRVWDGWRWLYVEKYRGGKVTFSLDHTYARAFKTSATARRIASEINDEF